jgi:hypothetical protein
VKQYEHLPGKHEAMNSNPSAATKKKRYILSTYVNVTMYPPAQLLYANKKLNKWKLIRTQERQWLFRPSMPNSEFTSF